MGNGRRRDEALLAESERVLAAAIQIADKLEELGEDLRDEVARRRARLCEEGRNNDA